MPSAITDFGAGTWLTALFGLGDPVTSYYVALCSDEPGEDCDGSSITDLEPADTAYVRQPYGVGVANWIVDGLTVSTLVDVDFGTPAIDWGLVTHFALCTRDGTNLNDLGDVFAYGEFLNAQYLSAGYQMVVPAGGVVLSLSSLDNSIDI